MTHEDVHRNDAESPEPLEQPRTQVHTYKHPVVRRVSHSGPAQGDWVESHPRAHVPGPSAVGPSQLSTWFPQTHLATKPVAEQDLPEQNTVTTTIGQLPTHTLLSR